MKRSSWFSPTLIGCLVLGAIAAPTTHAIRLADGTVYFAQPPSLSAASTTRSNTFVSNATYYFTLNLPDTAGEPLQRVAIAQQDGTTAARRVRFDAEDSRAFVGTRRNRDAELTIAAATYNEENQTVELTFDPPIPPGTTFTVGLSPRRNPRTDGVYLFGVTAFPAGESAYGQFLGFGRLHFYDGGNDFFSIGH
ncbi:MAG: DUF2808 domain-containing protein [Leptolyngbyaceae cyanobacterium SL_7_1]|nr:DUF2808 domain-containing protein [Leptolyngbyaceae cyanobacterium SL_7_1]